MIMKLIKTIKTIILVRKIMIKMKIMKLLKFTKFSFYIIFFHINSFVKNVVKKEFIVKRKKDIHKKNCLKNKSC